VAVFAYRAADHRGATIDGVMEAADARAVAERLQRDAYFPIRIAPQGRPRRLLGLAWPDLGRGRVASRDLVSFTQQLATLVEAGMPLDRALAIQVELAPTARLRAILGDVLRSVQGGSPLADALGKHHPRPFSRLYINMRARRAACSRPRSDVSPGSSRSRRSSTTRWSPRSSTRCSSPASAPPRWPSSWPS
jgi:general secretion pathway protein F